MDKATEERIRNTVLLLNEKRRRLYLANEAKAIGYGGISQVSRASGISRVTITAGLNEITLEGWGTRQWELGDVAKRAVVGNWSDRIIREYWN